VRFLLDQLESALQRDERSVRDVERYVTSETFSVRSRLPRGGEKQWIARRTSTPPKGQRKGLLQARYDKD
jgi:hypothetical protein